MGCPLFQHIARPRVEGIEAQEYEVGGELVEALELLRQRMKADLTAADLESESATLRNRLEPAQRNLQDHEAECSSRIEQLRSRLSEETAGDFDLHLGLNVFHFNALRRANISDTQAGRNMGKLKTADGSGTKS
jgi:hypothetical protein